MSKQLHQILFRNLFYNQQSHNISTQNHQRLELWTIITIRMDRKIKIRRIWKQTPKLACYNFMDLLQYSTTRQKNVLDFTSRHEWKQAQLEECGTNSALYITYASKSIVNKLWQQFFIESVSTNILNVATARESIPMTSMSILSFNCKNLKTISPFIEEHQIQ